MSAYASFDQALEKAARESGIPGVLKVIQEAEESAFYLVYGIVSAPESELNGIIMDCLCEILSYSKDKEVLEWYSERGVRF